LEKRKKTSFSKGFIAYSFQDVKIGIKISGTHYSVCPKMANFPNFGVPDERDFQQAQILILEILQCIPVVKIFTFLELEKIISFSDGH